MRSVTASAPGKLMLLGEYAVLCGYPCLAMAISNRTTVTITESSEEGVNWNVPSTDLSYVKSCVSFIEEQLDINLSGIQISITNPLIHISGLGSSSAVIVATLSALLRFLHRETSVTELFSYGKLLSKSIQKNGSGYDIATAVYGGVVQYKNGKIVEQFHEFPQELDIVVAFTGGKGNTKELIASFEQKRLNDSAFMEIIVSSLGLFAQAGITAFKKKSWNDFGKCMYEAHEQLQKLGVSTQTLDTYVTQAKRSRAIGAKLSGAGGGDCMISLVSKEYKSSVEQALVKTGAEIISVQFSDQGVFIHE